MPELSISLCWYCDKSACGGCSWSDRFTPVPGWTAEKENIKDYFGNPDTTYTVLECPEYQSPDYLLAAGRTRPPSVHERAEWTYRGYSREEITCLCRSVKETEERG